MGARLLDESVDGERAVDLERDGVAQRKVVVLRLGLAGSEYDWNAIRRYQGGGRFGLEFGAERSQRGGVSCATARAPSDSFTFSVVAMRGPTRFSRISR